MSRVSVRLRVKTAGYKVGDVVELEAEHAAYLIENRHALPVPAKAPKSAPKSNKD